MRGCSGSPCYCWSCRYDGFSIGTSQRRKPPLSRLALHSLHAPAPGAAGLRYPAGALLNSEVAQHLTEKRRKGPARGQRQYTGAAGKIVNCQLGVFLAYAGPKGRAPDRPGVLPAPTTRPSMRPAITSWIMTCAIMVSAALPTAVSPRAASSRPRMSPAPRPPRGRAGSGRS
jgi:hypothetical protein